jgi:hypothetical protein
MKSRKEALGEARKLIAGAQGVLGPRAVQGIVDALLPFVNRLRDAGSSWDQIALLLADAGLRSRKGGAVSADSLRAVASRARGRFARPVPSTTVAPVDVGSAAQQSPTASASPDRESLAMAGSHAGQIHTENTESLTLESRDRNKRLRDRMMRAATIRGSPPDAER